MNDPELSRVLAVAKRLNRRALIAYAWHDVTCPEGPDCRDRSLHAECASIVNTGYIDRFLDRLHELEASQ